ncbi:MAG: PilZ domain-containing protein [Terriglobales bacterium]
MSTDPNRLERRGAQRFEVHQPLAVHFEGKTVPGFVQNLSGRGIFFYTEMALPAGAIVELTFTMPSEITLAENMPVRCRGRVVRSSASPADQSPAAPRNGVAVQISSYQYLPANDFMPQFVRVSAAGAAGSVASPASR